MMSGNMRDERRKRRSRTRDRVAISTAVVASALILTSTTCAAGELTGRPRWSTHVRPSSYDSYLSKSSRRPRSSTRVGPSSHLSKSPICGLPSMTRRLLDQSLLSVRRASLSTHVSISDDRLSNGLNATGSSSPSSASAASDGIGSCTQLTSSIKTKSKRKYSTDGGNDDKSTARRRRYNNSGFYYGIREDLMIPPSPSIGVSPSDPRSPMDGVEGGNIRAFSLDDTTGKVESGEKSAMKRKGVAKRRPIRRRNSSTLTDIMGETLLELREMREEIFALREEMKTMKQQMWTAENGDMNVDDEEFDEEASQKQALLAEEAEHVHMPQHHEHPQQRGLGGLMAKRKRNRMFEKIGHDVEKWADKIFFEETCNLNENGEGFGWKEIRCAFACRKKFNGHGRFSCFLKWMPDSREDMARDDDEGREYPCVCVKGTIDAPIENVCYYLSRKENMLDYNELIVAHRDLEEITPHSKITWGQSPQILFVKPRDFVTYCHHRWKRDGTLVIVNQACEHEDAIGSENDKGGKVARASAIRGANYLWKDPDDPSKTKLFLIAHADPGGDLPQWACKSAVNAVAPIEPFKLFHNIESCVKEKGTPPPPRTGFAALPGRSSRPAGISQMGYACFWPQGGGLKEKMSSEEQGEPESNELGLLDEVRSGGKENAQSEEEED